MRQRNKGQQWIYARFIIKRKTRSVMLLQKSRKDDKILNKNCILNHTFQWLSSMAYYIYNLLYLQYNYNIYDYYIYNIYYM